MESTLVPEIHYILLKDDFSDLHEKYEWCKSHKEECKSIIRNAHQFMLKFRNVEREEEIEKEVIKRYFEKVVIV